MKQMGAFRDGAWSQFQPQRTWRDNWTSDCFVAFAWIGENIRHYVVVLNYSGNQAQCRQPLRFPEFRGRQVRLTDLLGDEVYDRAGDELADPGLYIGHSPWHYNAFELRAI